MNIRKPSATAKLDCAAVVDATRPSGDSLITFPLRLSASCRQRARLDVPRQAAVRIQQDIACMIYVRFVTTSQAH